MCSLSAGHPTPSFSPGVQSRRQSSSFVSDSPTRETLHSQPVSELVQSTSWASIPPAPLLLPTVPPWCKPCFCPVPSCLPRLPGPSAIPSNPPSLNKPETPLQNPQLTMILPILNPFRGSLVPLGQVRTPSSGHTSGSSSFLTTASLEVDPPPALHSCNKPRLCHPRTF